MTAGVFHRYFGSRTRPLFNKMLSNSIYMPNMTNPIFLSVKLGWLHLLCKMQTTVMDFQEFLASPPFWSFGEKAVGRRHGLVSKSSTWIKLLVCVNWEYFSCVFGMLLSCQCLHLLQLSVKVSLISIWEVDNLKQCVAVVDSMWLYWFIDLPVPGTCILQLVLPVKAEKIGSTESCRQWWTACWPLLISAWSCSQGSIVLAVLYPVRLWRSWASYCLWRTTEDPDFQIEDWDTSPDY